MMDPGLERPQSLIDRNQFDDRAPRIDEILKRGSHLCERIQDLVHRTQRDLAGNDRRCEQDVGKDDVGLQIDDAANIKIHEMQIEPEVIVANIAKQQIQCRWGGVGGIILAKHELLAIGRLNALVEKFDSRQPDADQRERAGAEHRPDHRGEHQRVGDGADQRQLRDVARQPQENRQEGQERQDGTDQIDAETFHRGGKSHGIFLHPLRGALDRAQPRPVGDVVVVHRGAPAEDVMADEEARHHADHDRDEGDAGEGRQFAVELLDRDRR
ncbi:hypothetical protein GALL_492680 [mine drainage metagenome]|uniref:Uncharacterized protein n=1 Tax=mine drainage metagenome TaxID=410659 RepID=A0A1J5PZS8_9ZZZZ